MKHIREASQVLDFNRPFPNWSDTSADPSFYLTQIRATISKKTMPPNYYKTFHRHDGKQLTSVESKLIVSWIKENLKRLATADTSPPSAQKYFSKTCLGCHNANIQSGGFKFDQTDGQLSISGESSQGIPFFTPSHPESSAVYLVLQADPTQRLGLPQMPPGDAAAPADQKLISDWINSGNTK